MSSIQRLPHIAHITITLVVSLDSSGAAVYEERTMHKQLTDVWASILLQALTTVDPRLTIEPTLKFGIPKSCEVYRIEIK